MHPGELAVPGDEPTEPGADPLVVLRQEPHSQVGNLRQTTHVVEPIQVHSAQVFVDDDDPGWEWFEVPKPARILLAVDLHYCIALLWQGGDDGGAGADVLSQ